MTSLLVFCALVFRPQGKCIEQIKEIKKNWTGLEIQYQLLRNC